jgi:hypothetical protein
VSKTPPPLLGFNNNVKHQGRVFHIQTEDSGVKHPRVVTHLFADDGRILRSSRVDYDEHVGRDDMVPIVKRIMKEQHKAMFIALRAGDFDEVIERASMTSLAPVSEPKNSEPTPAPAKSKAKSERPPASARSRQRSRALSNPNLRRVIPSVPPPSGEIDLDVESLDQHPPRPAPEHAVPSEPSPAAPAAVRPRRRPPPLPARATPMHGTPAMPPPPASPSEPAPGKYAPSRPAAIFAEGAPAKQSIFGESMISEKSLDEVILSYLAEDLEGSPQD